MQLLESWSNGAEADSVTLEILSLWTILIMHSLRLIFSSICEMQANIQVIIFANLFGKTLPTQTYTKIQTCVTSNFVNNLGFSFPSHVPMIPKAAVNKTEVNSPSLLVANALSVYLS